ncbi:MAG: hypothetical protein K8M05_04410, partial [Deltaproteobacteria bacterium]|nr:hypothetical protein [Kofleriaceae bacterium]
MSEARLGHGHRARRRPRHRAHAAQERGVRAADVRGKSNPRDLVTEWDTRAEELIRARLAALTPDIPMVGEEGGGDATAVRRW